MRKSFVRLNYEHFGMPFDRNPDGTIYEIKVLQSSGQRILDDAARQIVRLSAPFAQFPAEIRKQADRLQIIRTWNFEITGNSSTITTSAN